MASTRSLAIAAALVCLVMVFALPATAKSPHHHHKRHKHHDHDHDHHHEDDYEKQPACQAKQTCVPTIYQVCAAPRCCGASRRVCEHACRARSC